MTPADAMYAWVNAWEYEKLTHSSKEESFLSHIEGYIIDAMHLVSQIPVRITASSYIHSAINIVAQLRTHVTD